ncbi:MAG: DegT/DnrJ/EryC1/StrS family aminotransferase [Terriglobales bacterium]
MLTKDRLTKAGLNIPFHRSAMGEEEVQAVSSVIRSGWLTMGAKTFQFEREFAQYIGASHAVAVSSCTAALHLALDAIGLRPGDEVLVPTNTFTATAEAVTYMGGRPVLVDIDERTLNISVVDAEEKLTSRTRAMIPVHFSGLPCDLDEIHALAKSRDLHVIEDAAHSLPSLYRGRRIGKISELTAFSFYATKPLNTGEGGMITTENDTYAHRTRQMRLHGISHDAWKRNSAEGEWRYEVLEPGYKYNFTDMQAALGVVQLAKCDAMFEARRRIAECYTQALQSMEALEVPVTQADRESSWHLYVLRLQTKQLRIDRRQFIAELAERGVQASVHFTPLHLQPAYQRLYGYKQGDLPVAERQYYRCISLPIFPTMSEREVQYVTSCVTDIVDLFVR